MDRMMKQKRKVLTKLFQVPCIRPYMREVFMHGFKEYNISLCRTEVLRSNIISEGSDSKIRPNQPGSAFYIPDLLEDCPSDTGHKQVIVENLIY